MGAYSLMAHSSNASVFGDHINGHHYRGGLPLYPYDSEVHEAVWVIQRVWGKRQLRRGEAQSLIRRAFIGNR